MNKLFLYSIEVDLLDFDVHDKDPEHVQFHEWLFLYWGLRHSNQYLMIRGQYKIFLNLSLLMSSFPDFLKMLF